MVMYYNKPYLQSGGHPRLAGANERVSPWTTFMAYILN
jgi:hypothetical protein